MSRYLSLEELASMLDIERESAQRLCRQGRVPGAQKLGGTWIVAEKTLLEAGQDALLRRQEDTLGIGQALKHGAGRVTMLKLGSGDAHDPVARVSKGLLDGLNEREAQQEMDRSALGDDRSVVVCKRLTADQLRLDVVEGELSEIAFEALGDWVRAKEGVGEKPCILVVDSTGKVINRCDA